MSDVLVERDGHVFVIAINRPHKKNAFTLEVLEEIASTLLRLRRDPACRAIILTGTGDSFCAGVDLSIMEGMRADGSATPSGWKSLLMDRVHKIALALDDFDKPVIAAVGGPAYGAGMDLALMCDMRFVGASARMCEAYINLGVVPGDGGCYYLPRIVGLPKALELLLSGRVVGAAEALEIGLANRVCEDDALMAETMAFAQILASKSPSAVRMIKRATYQSLACDLRTSLDLISSHMGVVQSLDDTAEVARALKSGDEPNFKEQ
ncbi:enoyl-CoA hydratase/isomerase family protein [Futiania mangrovi]|uniref:Enoyl-CoA hydratase/isomerase family protein n=1 Tax=Futiania mangrovi TaxID=2959716 RepID=A0A9J6P7Y6_9PROT|nr:enoyl-CoA hydratase/isomerase family protein [Futiania mangrovii]MCP1335468.1 enoyl-CoA hydratase/isomerase family protein [Futiania mangrovii]